jgi:ribonuclease PH
MTEGEEKKELKAKTASLVAKITGAAVVLVGSVLKWVGVFQNCEINELCIVGFSVMGIFGTVDLNLLAEKFSRS